MLFDRICRENGIRHLLTAPRSPTTTGKIERFHGTLRLELLAGTTFPTLAAAQQAIDVWITSTTPTGRTSRWAAAPRPSASPPAPPIPARRWTCARWPTGAPATTGSAAGWPSTGSSRSPRSRSASASTAAARVVDVHVGDRLLEVWSRNELIKTVVRTSQKEVRKKRAERTARTQSVGRQASPETDWSTIN